MKNLCSVFSCCVLAVMIGSLCLVPPAHAFPNFLKAFQKKYAGDKKPETDEQKNLAQEMKRVKTCNVCHDPRPGDSGKADKKNRNPYGQALNKYLTEKDKNDVDKALEMLSKVEGEKAADDAPTYGELLKEGKLPFEYKDFKPGDDEDEDSN